MPNLTLKFEDKVFLEETTYDMIADDPISSEYFHMKLRMFKATLSAAHYYHFQLRENATLLAPAKEHSNIRDKAVLILL